jgi:hypothetical protein
LNPTASAAEDVTLHAEAASVFPHVVLARDLAVF